MRLWALALRGVRRNRRRSGLTALAFAVGALAVVSLRGFSEGFVQLVLEQIVRGRSGAIQVHRAGYVDALEALPTWLDLEHSPAFEDRLRAVPGVRAVAPRLRFTARASNGSVEAPVLVRAVRPDHERAVCPAFGTDVLPPGRALPDDEGATGAVLGRELAQALGLGPDPGGARVFLSAASASGRANALDVPVLGLSAMQLPFENKRVVTLPLALGQRLAGQEGRVSEYAVDVADLESPEPIAAALRAELGPGYEVHTWRQLEPYARDTLRRQRGVVAAVGAVLLLLVLLGIASTTFMGVHERTREIGMLLALGLRRRQVLALFVLESAVVGLAGAALGAAAGAAVVAFFGARGVRLELLDTHVTLYPVLEPGTLLLGLAAGVVAAACSAALPARQAARLDPVEALRDAG